MTFALIIYFQTFSVKCQLRQKGIYIAFKNSYILVIIPI
nr:MAG TPA: hypothetical protein [Caudoviricetes sp.]